MSRFIPRNEEEAEAFKSFRETGSPSALNSIGLVVKVATVGGIGGGVVYTIVRIAEEVSKVAANFTNGH